MSESRRVIFILEREQDEKIDAIAAHLARELGVSISRSSAVRVLVDRFFLPEWTVDRQKNIQPTNQAA